MFMERYGTLIRDARVIISKTPFRISLFGGGSDYPAWCDINGGAVLGASIDKYCYLLCRPLPPFFEHRYRVVYSRHELVANVAEIGHPAVRAILEFTNYSDGLEVIHTGDLPAQSGIGSSSSFAVGLLHAVRALRGETVTPYDLAKDAIYVEQKLLTEAVGYQDQIFAAYGGFNCLRFLPGGDFAVHPLPIDRQARDALNDHLLLFFTGKNRSSSAVAASYISMMAERQAEVRRTLEMVDEAIKLLAANDITSIGPLLHDSWLLKQRRGRGISNNDVDELYNAARLAGATGGKLTGAGGAGFLLVFASPDRHEAIRAALGHLVHVPFRFGSSGSSVVVGSEWTSNR